MIVTDDVLDFAAFGALVGVSRQAVVDAAGRGVVSEGMTARAMLLAYCSHLREMAAGRGASSGADLAAERAALAIAQRERVELQNAVTRGELVRAAVVERELASQLVALRESLEVLADRLSAVLAAETDAATCRALLLAEHRQAMKAFATRAEAQMSADASAAD